MPILTVCPFTMVCFSSV